MTHQRTPYAVLQSLIRPIQDQLAVEQDTHERLQGFLLLKAGSWSLAVAMGQINKVVALPTLASVPRVFPWVKGAVPIDGQWMPVIALESYFTQTAASITAQSKALIVQHHHKQVAIVVQQIMGSAYFSVDQFSASIENNTAEVLRPYAVGTYHTAEQDWLMLSLSALIDYPRFDTMVNV